MKIYVVIGYENTDCYSTPDVDVFATEKEAYVYMLKGYENTKKSLGGEFDAEESDSLVIEDQRWASITGSSATIVDGLENWNWEIREKDVGEPIDKENEKAKAKKAMECLADNGVEPDEAETVFTAIAQILDLWPEENLEDIIPDYVPPVMAKYCTFWDDGSRIVSDCKINPDTKRVFDIEVSDSLPSDDATCVREAAYTLDDGTEHVVYDLDEIIETSTNEDALNEIKAIKLYGTNFWRCSDYNFETLDDFIEYFKKFADCAED